MTNAQIIPAILIPFIAWRFYRRIRTNIGRQKFSKSRSIYISAIFGAVTALVTFSAVTSSNLLLSQAGGLLIGAVIGFVGLRLTVFEDAADGRYYTPNSYLGVAVSILLISRIAYRFFVLYSFDPATQPGVSGLGQSPLTLGLFGLTAGYYIFYHIGLLAKKGGVQTN